MPRRWGSCLVGLNGGGTKSFSAVYASGSNAACAASTATTRGHMASVIPSAGRSASSRLHGVKPAAATTPALALCTHDSSCSQAADAPMVKARCISTAASLGMLKPSGIGGGDQSLHGSRSAERGSDTRLYAVGGHLRCATTGVANDSSSGEAMMTDLNTRCVCARPDALAFVHFSSEAHTAASRPFNSRRRVPATNS